MYVYSSFGLNESNCHRSDYTVPQAKVFAVSALMVAGSTVALFLQSLKAQTPSASSGGTYENS